MYKRERHGYDLDFVSVSFESQEVLKSQAGGKIVEDIKKNIEIFIRIKLGNIPLLMSQLLS